MRLLVYSDLHLEFPGALEHFRVPGGLSFDAVVLAGDIHAQDRGLDWAARCFVGKPVVYVAGNHEYYGAHLQGLQLELRRRAADLGIHFLEQDELILGDIRFLGATLWTDFDLFGPGAGSAAAMAAAAAAVPDFRVIRTGPCHGPAGRASRHEVWQAGLLQPPDTVELSRRARSWLARKLAEPFAGRTVVVSHHLPSARSVAARYAADPVSAAFASHLDDLVGQADLWIHGHTHDSFDYRLGRCRVVCNPRGYPLPADGHAAGYCGDGRDRSRAENPGFRADLTVAVP